MDIGRNGRGSWDEDGLASWIDALRRRLDRGDLAGIGPIEPGPLTGHVPGETTVRIMLADLADLDDPAGSASRDPAWRDARRLGLRDDFRRLRYVLG